MFFDTLIINVRLVDFSGKPDYLEMVSFHCAILCVTIFGIALGVGIVHMVIFIKKICLHKTQDIFL